MFDGVWSVIDVVVPVPEMDGVVVGQVIVESWCEEVGHLIASVRPVDSTVFNMDELWVVLRQLPWHVDGVLAPLCC